MGIYYNRSTSQHLNGSLLCGRKANAPSKDTVIRKIEEAISCLGAWEHANENKLYATTGEEALLRRTQKGLIDCKRSLRIMLTH